ncbi:MAG TPA: alkaline phosphatase family protein [Acidimicrobiales bacterium]|nr:alkaline phosphatase family protein [Acidimicrobiales bacterium]
MARHDKSAAIDHVVVLMFENRSFDNVLGRLYEPGEVASFEGVLGKDLESDPAVGRARRGPREGRLRRRRGHERARPGPR